MSKTEKFNAPVLRGASEPMPAPISLVRQRSADFSEGYRAGFDGAENGEADDTETAWALSKASAELADMPSASDVLAVAEQLEQLAVEAEKVSDRQCKDGRWTMCIPVQDSDSDMVIYALAREARKAAALLRSTGSREAT